MSMEMLEKKPVAAPEKKPTGTAAAEKKEEEIKETDPVVKAEEKSFKDYIKQVQGGLEQILEFVGWQPQKGQEIKEITGIEEERRAELQEVKPWLRDWHVIMKENLDKFDPQ